VGFFADHETRGAHVDALGGQGVDFAKEDGRIKHHAVADEAYFARVQNARGDEVQHALLATHNKGVPSVVAALKANDGGAFLRQHIHDFAFALIAPLGPEDHDI